MPRLKTGTPHADASAALRGSRHSRMADWHMDRARANAQGSYAHLLSDDAGRLRLHAISSRHEGRAIAHGSAASRLLHASKG